VNDLGGGLRAQGTTRTVLDPPSAHVDIGRIHGALVVGVVAGDGLQKKSPPQAHAFLLGEFSAGMSLPRATPAMSGMMASTSEMPCSFKNC